MRSFLQATWVFGIVLASALPAYANNPPQPDGILSLLLIFPVVMLAFHFSGTQLTEQQRKWRIGKGFLLGVTVFLTLGGTGLAMPPLLILALYGGIRGADIIRRGQGGKRIVLGTAVIVWTLFAVSNYVLSLSHWPLTAQYEATAVRTLRTLARAEERFAAGNDTGKPRGTYASLEELQREQLINERLFTELDNRAYRFQIEASSQPEQFFVSAVPVNYTAKESEWPAWLPGRSWKIMLQPRSYGARRSFTVDETGVIRQADLGTSRPVTRREAAQWQPLN